MALKKLLTSEEHAKLPTEIKKEYIADGDGFKLDVEGGFEDVSALKRAKDHEKKEAAEAKRQLKEAQDSLSALTEERDGLLKGAIPKADVEKLETSYKTKLAKREQELTAEIQGLTGNLNTMLVDNVAITLATKLSGSPEIILPHIKARLRADVANGKATTRVLDAQGQPSASTLEELEKEFIANKAFAPILTGSKGSGGGATGSNRGGGANTGKTIARVEFDKLPPTEQAKFISEKGAVVDQ